MTISGKIKLRRGSSASIPTLATGELVYTTDEIQLRIGDGVVSSGIAIGAQILDEDDMVSDSAIAIPTQQSAKAYLDTELAWIDCGEIDVTLPLGKTWDSYAMVVNYNNIPQDSNHVFAPSVILDGSTYKMWYSGRDGSTWRIMYATSTNGTTWTNYQMVVDINQEQTYDTINVRSPCVIKDGETYKMWYGGYDGTTYRIMYATSTNGTTWTGHTMVVNINQEQTYDTDHILSPCVIKDGETYKMWYTCYNGSNYRIMYATSINGTTWTGHTLAVNINQEQTYDTTQVHSPCVIKDSETYKMWYSCYDGSNWRIIYADSSDGTTWTNYEMVVDIGAQGTYDTTNAYNSTILLDGTDLIVYYTGYDGTNFRIIRAVATD